MSIKTLSFFYVLSEIKPTNWQDQRYLADKMRDIVFNKTGQTYENLVANKVFQTSGNSLDYYSMVKSIPFPYTILLPDAKIGDTHGHSEAEIEPISRQVLTAMDVLAEYIGEKFQNLNLTLDE
jgi:hypothetical protein